MNRLKIFFQYLLILTLFTPLLVDLHFYQPYISVRYFAFILLLLLVLPGAVYFLITQAKIKFNLLISIVFLFFTYLVLVSFFSVDKISTWYGDWQRFDGLVYFIFFCFFFLALVTFFDQKNIWLKFLRTNQIIVLATLIWSYGQRFSWGIFTDEQAGRVYALIGNANFLAHYLLLALFLSLFLVYFDQKFKYWHGILAALIIPVILWTSSRAAFISLVFIFFSLIIFAIFKFWQQSKKISLILFFLALFVVLFAVNFLSPRFTAYSLQDTTIETRLVAWQAGVKAWQDRPLLGWGKNNFNLVFNKYFDLKIYKGSGTRMWFDKAHNQYIDYLVEGGLFGLLFYLVFLFVPFLYFKKIKKNHGQLASIFLFSGLVANLIFLAFNFDTFNALLLYFVYLALIYFLSQEKQTAQTERIKLKKNYFVLICLISSLVISFLLFFIFLLPQIEANIALKKLYLSDQANLKFNTWQETAKLVSQKNPNYQADLSLVLAEGLEKNSWQTNQNIEALENVLYYGALASKQHILDAKIHYLIANTYLRLGAISGRADYLQKAINYYQEILPQITNPLRPDLLYHLASAKYNLFLFTASQEEKDILKNDVLEFLENNAQDFSDVVEAQEKLNYFQFLFSQ